MYLGDGWPSAVRFPASAVVCLVCLALRFVHLRYQYGACET